MAASGVEARPIDEQCPSTPIDEQCWWLCGCHAAPHRCRAVSAVFATAAPTALTAPTVCDGHCCNPLPAANTSISAASIDEHWHWQRPMQHARRTLPPWRRAQNATKKRFSPVCGLLPKHTPPIGQQPAIDMLTDDTFGASRPPSRGRTTKRIESEVGDMVGHGGRYPDTPVYIRFSLGSGSSTMRWIGYAQV